LGPEKIGKWLKHAFAKHTQTPHDPTYSSSLDSKQTLYSIIFSLYFQVISLNVMALYFSAWCPLIYAPRELPKYCLSVLVMLACIDVFSGHHAHKQPMEFSTRGREALQFPTHAQNL